VAGVSDTVDQITPVPTHCTIPIALAYMVVGGVVATTIKNIKLRIT
jgi:hypothetical protein